MATHSASCTNGRQSCRRASSPESLDTTSRAPLLVQRPPASPSCCHREFLSEPPSAFSRTPSLSQPPQAFPGKRPSQTFSSIRNVAGVFGTNHWSPVFGAVEMSRACCPFRRVALTNTARVPGNGLGRLALVPRPTQTFRVTVNGALKDI